MGETAEVGLAELLSVLAHRQHSGRLTIVSEGEEAQIFLYDGKVILINSSNPALRLGRILLRLGILTGDQVDNALRAQHDHTGRRPLGQILVDAGAVTTDDLARAAEEQCIEALTRVMVSKHGTFMFNRDIKPVAQQGLVALSTDRIVLEASRRADEMVTLRSLLPPAGTPLVASRKMVRQAGDQLTSLERQVLDALVEGTGTLDDLAQRVPVEEVALWRTAVSLRERGLIMSLGSAQLADPEAFQDAIPSRTVDEVARLCAEGTRGLTSRVPNLAEVRAGTPAGTQTVAAITVVIREVIAAFNAGLTLRAYANFSDDHFRRRGLLPDGEIETLRGSSRPLQPEEQETFLAIREVRVLQDGRVSVILSTHVPAAGETRKVLIFTRAGDRWQIDAVIEPPGTQPVGAAPPQTSPAASSDPA
jgi:hypothetical protein